MARQAAEWLGVHVTDKRVINGTAGLRKRILRWGCLILDVALVGAVAVAAPVMWLVRRVGLQRLGLCRRVLDKVGVLPIRRHYYDPYVDATLVRTPLGAPRELPGLDLRVSGQLGLLRQMGHAGELSKWEASAPAGGARRFHLGNGSFESGDAEFLYQFIRLKKPRRVVEIGSGYSTLVVRDALSANRLEHPGAAASHVCIEPFEMPWLEETGAEIVRSRVEDVPWSVFSGLDAGDLLFIDSSHMIRPQGDVLHEYQNILPRLKPGVFVHVHDIFTPRDYPEEWVLRRHWLWNEQYLVETMLAHGSAWEVVAALNFLKHAHFGELKAICPFVSPDREPGSLYIVKKA